MPPLVAAHKVEEVGDLPPLSDAIAQPNPEAIFLEAMRQYEHMLLVQAAGSTTTTNQKHAQSTGKPEYIDMAAFYRKRFHAATEGLDMSQKHHLLILCFAFKTKARILRFLGYLEDSSYAWVPLLVRIVRKNAVDTAFPPGISESSRVDRRSQRAAVRRVSEHDNEQSSRTTPSPRRTAPIVLVSQATKPPFFVIATLPLAFPSTLFSALALHAPIEQLTVRNMLKHPAALQLALSTQLKETLRLDLEDIFYAHAARSNAPLPHDSSAWRSCVVALLQSRVALPLARDKQPDHDFRDAGSGDGYTHTDLSLWLAGWKAERQRDGTKERGQETSLMKRKLSLTNAGSEEQHGATVDEDEHRASVAPVRGRRKKVSWSEKLESVREVPSRRAMKAPFTEK